MDNLYQNGIPIRSRRFVILWHALPRSPHASLHGRSSHFDLMFEQSEQLITFEMRRIPIPGERMRLIRLGDHRLDYLEFEGPLTPDANGFDRGHVARWAAGNYHFFRRTREKHIIELTSDRFSARIVMKPQFEASDLSSLASPSLAIEWPPIPDWEMYVPRWSLNEKSCSKT